jgi:4-aminobutyrate aminotransferase-like enzyme
MFLRCKKEEAFCQSSNPALQFAKRCPSRSLERPQVHMSRLSASLDWRLKAALAQNSFHGRTFGSMAVTTSKTYYRQGFAPLMPQVVVAPYPYCLHCRVRQADPSGAGWYKVVHRRLFWCTRRSRCLF